MKKYLLILSILTVSAIGYAKSRSGASIVDPGTAISGSDIVAATDLVPGVVSISAQTFGGVKTFNSGITMGDEVFTVFRDTTWTPTLKEGANTITTGSGKYLRVGNWVILTASFVNITASGSGNLSVTGLPFAPIGVSACASDYAVITFAASENLAAKITATAIFPTALASGSDAAAVTASDLHPNNSDMFFTCAYLTAP